MYDQIKTQLDTLAELNDEQVAELQAEIISQFEMVEGEDPTPETVDAMTSLADSLDIVKGELSRREVLAEELAARAAEATARVKGTAEETGEEMAMDEPTNEDMPVEDMPAEEAPVEEAPAEEIPAEEEATEEATETEEEEKKEPVKASAETPSEDASINQEIGSELSTEESVVAEETITADASVEEVATEETVEEAAVEAEAPAVEEAVVADASGEDVVVAEEAVAEETAVVEAVEGSEASTEETILETSPIAEEIQQEEQATVTASAEGAIQVPADRQPVVQVTESVVAITAGADIPGYTAGSTINDMHEVAQAMEKRIHSLRRVNGGDGEQHIVASITTQFDEARTLTTDAEANSAKIAAFAAESQALVASGGHGAPFEVKYDIFGLGSTTARPVRDSLPKFQADRGGIRYVTPPSFASGDYANAVGLWTAANDSAETPSPSAKTSLTVGAAAELTATTDAVTLQLQFGNLMTRAYPELIARHNELALVQHAREAEVNLLDKISTASTAVTTSNLIGFGRDFLVQVRRAAVAYRSRHRIDPSTQLKAIVPDWVVDAMAVDLTLSMPGDGTIALAKSEIEGYLANSNVSLTMTPDQNYFGSQGASALLEFPDSFKWFLFAEGTFLFLDGGTLDLGIIRDSSLVGTNDYKMFVETFEGVAKVGIESLAITSTISINGVAAALRDTTGGTAAATIEL